MFYNFLYPLCGKFSFFNVFKYITVRTGGALLTSLVLGLVVGPSFIRFLKKRQKKGQPIRDCGPETHFAKSGTPTMGGILILGTTLISTLLWADLKNPFIWLLVFVILGFGAIGAYDDLKKISTGKYEGIKSRWKFFFQGLLSIVVIFFVLRLTPDNLYLKVSIPFFKNQYVYLGWFYFLWGILVIAGSSNAVNLTDGLDGLAIMPSIYVAASFVIISYLTGNSIFSDYLYIHHIPGSGEIAVVLGALIGGGLVFLWFNAPPAKIFMGDSGSLSIGAILGSTAVMVHHELVLAISGGVFVMETVSVILQILVFKLTNGKRIFLMAPIHHHFEKKGWAEATITIRFWIISLILSIIGLASLKLR